MSATHITVATLEDALNEINGAQFVYTTAQCGCGETQALYVYESNTTIIICENCAK